MAKRMRRCALNIGADAGTDVTGVRDFTFSEANPQYDRTRADNESVGDEVYMGSDGFDIGFELLAPHASVATGYCAKIVVTGAVVERDGADENVVDYTYTFEQGHLEIGGDLNTDNPGRISVKGNFKTLLIAEVEA
jgi:hypothetical protein